MHSLRLISQGDCKLSKVRNWWWFIDRIGNYEAHMHAITKTVMTETTKFQEVGIMESVSYGKILVLDGDMQSSQYDEFIYHESIVQPAMIAHKNPKKILILGGGEGATLREVLRHNTVEKVVMIDIDARLVDICKEFLPEYSQGSFEDKRVTLITSDALKWLEEHDDKFDVIIADLTDPLPYTPSSGIYSIPFFELLKSHLGEGGIFSTQSSRVSFIDMHLHCVLYSAIKKVFPNVKTAVVSVPGFDVPWSFTSAYISSDLMTLTMDEINSRIAERIGDNLKFYDGETHNSIFSLQKYVRQTREDFLEGKIVKSTENYEPFYII